MSKPNRVVITGADIPSASPILSNAIQSGDKGYLAGVIGIDEAGKKVSGGVGAETKAALGWAAKRLSFAGLDLSDVISVTIYLSNYSQDFAGLNEAYISSFPAGTPLPVRTCVGVAALPMGCAVEMTLIAATRA